MASSYRQDMPPKGGYGPIDWARKTVKRKPISGWLTLGGIGAVSAGWFLVTMWFRKRLMREELEMREGRLALEPFMNAEMDRMLLRQFRKNRDEENELMKDVPGWVTGTIYGEPVYHNVPDRFPVYRYYDVYAHTKPKVMMNRALDKHNHG